MPNLSEAQVDAVVEPLLSAARVPGAGVAIVENGRLLVAKGYGRRDGCHRPVSGGTLYPIASTSKAFNATLLAMLVDEGLLDWDRPVVEYLPHFRLGDAATSAAVTLRDLVAMRTGLPRHDWVWYGYPRSRAELARRIRDLPLSCGFRDRFQYSNLTVIAAAHVAEVVTGRTWEALVQNRILNPLGMRRTRFSPPLEGDFTLGWRETSGRRLVPTNLLPSEHTAPSGGAIWSTAEDMARWLLFNQHPDSPSELKRPQIPIAGALSSVGDTAAYGMGWIIDTYDGVSQISHGGYLHDVNSDVALFPEHGLGVVAFVNFGPPNIAGLLTRRIADAYLGRQLTTAVEERLAAYEEMISSRGARLADRTPGRPRPPRVNPHAYAGLYWNAGYGEIEISIQGRRLVLWRGALEIWLAHWDMDCWIADSDDFAIHAPHPFDAENPAQFEIDECGQVAALHIAFEASLPPITFQRRGEIRLNGG